MDVVDSLRKGKEVGEDPVEQVMSAYREVFLRNDAGRKVLAHICNLGGMWKLLTNDQDRITSNFCKQILCNCGIWGEDKGLAIVEELAGLA